MARQVIMIRQWLFLEPLKYSWRNVGSFTWGCLIVSMLVTVEQLEQDGSPIGLHHLDSYISVSRIYLNRCNSLLVKAIANSIFGPAKNSHDTRVERS